MSAFHNQRLIDKKRARRHEKRIFMHPGDDVHFAGHSNHQIVRWLFHLQHNGVTLGVGSAAGCTDVTRAVKLRVR